MRRKKGFMIFWVVWLLWIGITYYISLPAINLHSMEFWFYLIIVVLLPLAIALAIRQSAINISKSGIQIEKGLFGKASKMVFGVIALSLVILGLNAVFSAKIFHAKRYASILNIQEKEFTEDIDQSTALSKIALMDTSSAIRLGNRELGSLAELVSQYNVSEHYAQIDVNGAPMKVSALDYDGFFKWLGNRKQGVPGYVTVDPVGQNANYVKLDSGMKYVPSAFFNERLDRHIRFQYPTKYFGNTHFEVDEEGKPYYVSCVYDFKIGLFSGTTVKGAIICDPVSGDCSYYDVKDIPVWVDNVFDGELLTTQYNWYGELSNGFWNSQIGKKGCKKCTETTNSSGDGYVADYGYISKDGDIWIYTGVTSVNDDASNIGFILVNQRTAEAHYFMIPGADESSAMSAAEGEVQEKRYEASFPSLVNIDNQPTYVMVLKDQSGIVKMYAMVNVEQYNIVSTANTLDECFVNYRKRLGIEKVEDLTSSEEKEEKPLKEYEIEIASLQYVSIEGDTYVYLLGTNGLIFRQRFADNEQLISLHEGDSIKVYARENMEGAYPMEDFSRIEEN